MEWIDLLEDTTGRFAEVLETADLTAPVPTCPGWSLADLGEHLRWTHAWASHAVTAGTPDGDSPAPGSERTALVAGYRTAAAEPARRAAGDRPGGTGVDVRRREDGRVLAAPPGARGHAAPVRRPRRPAGDRLLGRLRRPGLGRRGRGGDAVLPAPGAARAERTAGGAAPAARERHGRGDDAGQRRRGAGGGARGHRPRACCSCCGDASPRPARRRTCWPRRPRPPEGSVDDEARVDQRADLDVLGREPRLRAAGVLRRGHAGETPAPAATGGVQAGGEHPGVRDRDRPDRSEAERVGVLLRAADRVLHGTGAHGALETRCGASRSAPR
ncbi:maleylpyruvate isomerase N-terminal domain-containing protein [Nocardioides convexus]|uniref:maleylpyruvate isomerase N-terminal domain-containing protein n=1 Tax=Nocardioides convexus TaxID=2712224 RepID=UPI00241879A1|nr:maleylpyruvate isomerase N-terminal domain-containing protein [Nocardioides convexus]